MSTTNDLPPVAERFLRYVQIDTQSDRKSDSTPSTAKQKDLSELLWRELRDLGLDDAEIDEYGYVYAGVPASPGAEDLPAVALVAHVDTSPDEPGGPVKPVVHRNYDGSVLVLPGDPSVSLDPERSPGLLKHIGHDVISSDGTTLLGSDDKAGVAIAMQTAADLLAAPDQPRPPLKICFTVDEEIGRGVDKLDYERLGADVAYTIDGGPVGELDTRTFNAAEAVVRVEGVSVHTGTAKDVMANAAAILTDLLADLPAAETPEATQNDEGFFCPYELSGSIARAEARILLRDFATEGLERRKQLIRQCVDFARVKHPRARIELEITDTYKNMKSYIEDIDSRTISFALAAGKEMGLELDEKSVRGGTDGSRLSEEGLPTPNIFTGGHDYHSRFEWNTVQNLETSLAYVKKLLAYWAEHARDPGA